MHDPHCETGYETLRAAVLEGVVFHADKARSLSIIVTLGTTAWIRVCQGAAKRKAPTAARDLPRQRSSPAGQLVTLFANLAESCMGSGSAVGLEVLSAFSELSDNPEAQKIIVGLVKDDLENMKKQTTDLSQSLRRYTNG